jgi:hypothetical protein
MPRSSPAACETISSAADFSSRRGTGRTGAGVAAATARRAWRRRFAVVRRVVARVVFDAARRFGADFALARRIVVLRLTRLVFFIRPPEVMS